MRIDFHRSLGALVLLLAAVPAFAVTTYSDLTSWSAAATGVNTIDFNSIGTGLPSSLTTGGITFSPLGGSPSVLEVLNQPVFVGCNNHCLATDQPGQNGISISPTTNGITAMGFNLFTATLAGQLITLKVFYVGNGTSTEDYLTTATDNGALTAPLFFGITSSFGIQRIEITSATAGGQGSVVLDNFAFGQAGEAEPPPSDTPESASLGYVGLGLVGLILGARKRIRAARNVSCR